jgi:tripartite-type tricarboxylate transporter receptor subunit TctC
MAKIARSGTVRCRFATATDGVEMTNSSFCRPILFAAIIACLGLAHAQEFPAKPVRIIVPNSPGAGTDTVARLFAQGLQEIWKQPVVVEYKPGAGMVVGTDYVAKSAPDGYTIALVQTAHMINPSVQANMPFDTLKDLAGISLNTSSQIVLLATQSLPANSLREVMALAKKQPQKLSYASPGSGSAMHLTVELLKSKTGMDILHIPYKGNTTAFVDVMAGRVQFLVATLYGAMPYIKGGKLKAIAVAGPARAMAAPDIPTVAETVPGFDVRSVSGMVVPGATPRPVVHRISADVNALLKQPKVRTQLAEMGLEPVGSTPEQFDAYIKAEIDKWAKVVKLAGAKAD